MPTFDLHALTPKGDLIGIMEVKNRSMQQTVDKLVAWLSTGNWEGHPIVQGEIRNTQTKKAVYAATYRKHPKMDDVAMVIPQRLIEAIGKMEYAALMDTIAFYVAAVKCRGDARLERQKWIESGRISLEITRRNPGYLVELAFSPK